MVKAYLRYEPTATFGVITSGATVAYAPGGSTVITAALESVEVWNVRTGELVRTLAPPGSTGGAAPEVTQVACSPDGKQLAVGHADGTLRLWLLESGQSEPPAAGHKSGVSALRYSANGALLASGGQDTNVVVWDVTSITPLYRLQGHLGQVTDMVFLQQDSVLVSCSKDGYIRAWELSSQHCFQTQGGQHGEVWGLDANPEGTRVIAGFAEPELQMFRVAADDATLSTSGRTLLQSMGHVPRTTTGRAASVRFSPSGSLLACLGPAKAVELYRMRSEAEAQQHMKRRRKRKREKLSKAGDEPMENGEAHSTDEERVAADELVSFQVVRSKSKVRAVAFSPKKTKTELAQLSLALGSNAVEVWTVGDAESSKQHSIDAAGHRSGVRAVALSSDDSLLLTAAETSVKIWNPRSTACLRHVDINHGLCAMFAPGNRHAVVGTKEGTLDLVDVGAGDRIQAVEAHKGAVWAVAPLPDNSGLVSGSADHEAKFWEWEVREEAQEGAQPRRLLGLRHTRTIKMTDDVLAVKITPDGRLIALALLDSTVQILFLDSLKLKGSLYGHKLPVLSMDISSDSTLLVTASADKNIKIWGLDFNDCHKSIFAHSDSVMQVAFVPNTHYVFTVGKDGLLKYWDADRWELLLELPGHHAEVWCLVVSALGDMVITGSADRSIRRWERTDEPFFAEEERENRIESLFEADQHNPHVQQKRTEIDGPAEATTGMPGLNTPAARDAMGALADALEDAAKEKKRLEEFAAAHVENMNPPSAPANPLLLGQSPAQYVLCALAGIRPADLEQALLLLPFNYSLDLLDYLCYWLEQGIRVELACRVAVLLVRLHHRQLVATPSVRAVLIRVRELLHSELKKKKDVMGFNLAGTNHLLRVMQERKAILPRG